MPVAFRILLETFISYKSFKLARRIQVSNTLQFIPYYLCNEFTETFKFLNLNCALLLIIVIIKIKLKIIS